MGVLCDIYILICHFDGGICYQSARTQTKLEICRNSDWYKEGLRIVRFHGKNI